MIKVNHKLYSNPYTQIFQNLDVNVLDESTKIKHSKENKTDKNSTTKIIDRKKDIKKYLAKLTKQKNGDKKTDIEELVNIDGAMSNSRIPILDPRLHPKKTMDQTVSAAAITNDPITRGYRTYYGESVLDVYEKDMSKFLGYEETKNKSGKETYKFYVDKLGLDDESAEQKTEEQGKNPEQDPEEDDIIFKGRLEELRKNKVLKIIEDILTNKKNSNDFSVLRKKTDISKLLVKNIKTLKAQANKEGLTISELIKLFKGE